jgi:hypothetical protein
MRYRQKKKTSNAFDWSEWSNVQQYFRDEKTLNFVCDAEHAEGVLTSTKNYAVLGDWIDNAYASDRVVTIDARHLLIEIEIEEGDSGDAVKRLIDTANGSTDNDGAINLRSKEFLDEHYDGILYAAAAIQHVLEEHGGHAIDAISMVRNIFLETLLTHIEHCREQISDELAEFSMDIYCYMHSDISSWTYQMNAQEKRSQLFSYKEIFKEHKKLSLEELSKSIESVRDLCKIYDNATGEAVEQSLCTALERFSYLLTHTDGTVTKSEEEFYGLFRGKVPHVLTTDADKDCRNDELHQVATKTINISQDECLERIVNEVYSLIGLDNIKKEISDLLNLLKVQKMRRDAGLPSPELSRHMVFYGNPGTGKTTIARKLSEIYGALGVLSKGHLIETDRSSLVAGYLGQTAIKTKEVLERAKGGILFIDEAYTLSQGGEQDQFGQEAIDTILKYMEDHRDDLIVIVAGYDSKMNSFIDSNPGLKSRFSKYLYFDDYTALELAAIFKEMAVRAQYVMSDEFSLLLDSTCQEIIAKKGEDFGNG